MLLLGAVVYAEFRNTCLPAPKQVGESRVVKLPAKAAAVGILTVLSGSQHTLLGSLKSIEEEKFVLLDRSANRAAKLVALQVVRRCLRQYSGGVDKICRYRASISVLRR